MLVDKYTMTNRFLFIIRKTQKWWQLFSWRFFDPLSFCHHHYESQSIQSLLFTIHWSVCIWRKCIIKFQVLLIFIATSVNLNETKAFCWAILWMAKKQNDRFKLEKWNKLHLVVQITNHNMWLIIFKHFNGKKNWSSLIEMPILIEMKWEQMTQKTICARDDLTFTLLRWYT